MSYSNYEKAMELAPQCKFYTTAGGKNEEEIKKAEELLGVKFSAQLTDFYKKYGYLSFFGTEIFGIEPFDTSGELEGNSVAYALNDRFEYGLPNEWIPIFNCGDGSMVYLDYSTLNGDNERESYLVLITALNIRLLIRSQKTLAILCWSWSPNLSGKTS